MLLNAQAPMSITVTNTGIPNQRHSVHADLHGDAGRQRQVEDHAQQGTHWLLELISKAVANSTDVGGSGGVGVQVP